MLDMLCLTGEVGLGAPVAAPAADGRPPARAGDADRAVPARARATRGGAAAPTPATPSRHARRRRRARCSTLLRARGASFFRELVAACGLDADAAAHARSASWSPPGWSPRTASPACARSSGAARGRAGAARPARAACAGRWTALDGGAGRRADPRRGRRDCRPGRCCAATASSSAGCSRARRTPRPGASWRASTAGSKRAARSAAADSSPACRGEQFALPRRRRTAARGAPHAGRRPADRRSAPPIRSTSPASSPPASACARRAARRIVYRDGMPLAVADGDGLRELTPLDPSLATDVARVLKARPATALALR